ncbi:MAG TPA: glycosyltransferase family A protein [Clostridia bacterium]|nr:glycosyltransferase family A protein [Clostridia bacterium]
MRDAPALSVVIPTWNRATMVVDAVESALAQDSPEPIEVIVVDDGSEDDSPAVLIELARRPQPAGRTIRVILRSHRGLTSTMQCGIDAASGAYVSLLDSDDLWETGRASGLLAEERRLGGNAVVYTNYRKMDSSGALTGRLGFDPRDMRSLPVDTPALRLAFLRSYVSSVFHSHAFPGSICIFPREMLQGHYALPEGAVTQDFWVALVAYLRYAVAYLDVATLRVREHPGQHHALTDANRWTGLVDEQVTTFSAVTELLRADVPAEARLIEVMEARRRLTVLRRSALEGHRLACLIGSVRMVTTVATHPALGSAMLSNVILSISPRLFAWTRYRHGRRRLDDLTRYGRETHGG